MTSSPRITLTPAYDTDKDARTNLVYLLTLLERKYPNKMLLAEALGVKYVTVAHYYDGRSYPSFATTLKILTLLGLYQGAA